MPAQSLAREGGEPWPRDQWHTECSRYKVCQWHYVQRHKLMYDIVINMVRPGSSPNGHCDTMRHSRLQPLINEELDCLNFEHMMSRPLCMHDQSSWVSDSVTHGGTHILPAGLRSLESKFRLHKMLYA